MVFYNKTPYSRLKTAGMTTFLYFCKSLKGKPFLTTNFNLYWVHSQRSGSDEIMKKPFQLKYELKGLSREQHLINIPAIS